MMRLTTFCELSIKEIEELIKEKGGMDKLLLATRNYKSGRMEKARLIKKFFSLSGALFSSGQVRKRSNKYGVFFVSAWESNNKDKGTIGISFGEVGEKEIVFITLEKGEVYEVTSSTSSYSLSGVKYTALDMSKSVLWYKNNPGVYGKIE